MKSYSKPMVIVNDELAESVFAASGDCYEFTARIVQLPALGNPYYTIQIDGRHNADHHSTSRTVQITFNKAVKHESSNAISVTGDGTAVLSLTFTDGFNGSYHNNNVDNIGLGQLKVQADDGLAIIDTVCTYCNTSCDQH